MTIPGPRLIVTVDTEEDGLWGDPSFLTQGRKTVKNIQGIPRFQALCQHYGVHPTYLVNTPIIEDGYAVDLLGDLQQTGVCEIGAHIHPWCAPPFGGEGGPRYSYLCNLPENLQREKLVRLTEMIEAHFGRRPLSFRAGRYGLDIVGAKILGQLGYLVDSSVTPFHDFSGDGGPDFRHFPYKPYWVNGSDLATPGRDGAVLEVPISVGFSRRGFRTVQAIRELCLSMPLRRLPVVGALDRLNLVRYIKFTPESADAARMKQLVNASVRERLPCMVMALHSSSLVAGHSAYVPDERRLERLYRDLDAALAHCTGQHAMRGDTLSGFAARFQKEESCARR